MRPLDWVSLIASASSILLLIRSAWSTYRLRRVADREPQARLFLGLTLLLCFVAVAVAATLLIRGGSLEYLLVSALVLSCSLFVSILIRDQGQLEQLVERRTTELTTVNSQMQSLLDNMPAGVVFARAPSGEPLLVNRKATELLGSAAEQAKFTPASNGSTLVRPDGKPYPLQDVPLVRTLATGQPHATEDLVIVKQGHERMRLMMAATPVRDSNGTITSAVCVFQDISERERIEALRDSLTHIIVHDLRNPLHAISGYLELMSESGYIAKNRDSQECFRHVRTNCQNLVNMTTALLDLSKMEAGEMRLTVKECRLREIWPEANAEIDALAKLKDLNVVVKIPPRLSPVMGDRSMLRRVLVNLLTNAICFAPLGSTLTVSARRDGAVERVEVTDEGPGIHPDYHDLIFQKSGRVETGAKGTYFSTGLGLAFCKTAVEVQGGQIGVESVVGQGSTFWFTVPVAPNQPQQESAAKELALN